jgi:cysteine desulfurase
MEHHLPGNLNMSFVYVEGESLLMGINDVAVSSGSACTSATLEPSYVLKALGLGDDVAHSSIRFGLGRFNTMAEVDYVGDKVIEHRQKLRELSPLYEMVKEGIDLTKIEWAALTKPASLPPFWNQKEYRPEEVIPWHIAIR